ncbi:hypothetical protein GCM10022381_01080 [Leifsonia kafniensis]|uniref:Thioredoxin domain-containing protein n=2 Tax=Leifsonia kafniensis TaxID=475957 RepID=A0ABP7JZI8_9MICO
MHPLAAFALVLALVAVATGLGLVWRRRQGRVRAVGTSSHAGLIQPADVASSAPFGAHATLLQFSTDFCARCPGTHRLLGAVADARPGVVHLDVDLTHRADLANRFNILQTPTTIVLDGSGRIRARVSGVPDRGQLARQLDELLRSDNVHSG